MTGKWTRMPARFGLLPLLTLALAGCMTGGGTGGPALRVGVTPDYPPIVYEDGGAITGMEAEFARRMARELGRTPEFVSLRWDEQMPALMRGEIDVIMSGMTITDARQIRIAFSEPYLETGLIALIRRKDAKEYDSPDNLMQSLSRVGYKKGTTAEGFVRDNFPNARKRSYLYPSDAALELVRNRLDIFVHDGPAVAWLVSEHEAELTALFTLLTDDRLGWGVRRGNRELLDEINLVLAGWKADGLLDQIVDYWLPYRKNFTQ